jgi:putative colanic acid biosynthesis UDP-glucose lipid carrier transferase
MFVTDLIQGKRTLLCGVPVISSATRHSTGLNGLLKRGSDTVLSIIILLPDIAGACWRSR